MIPKQGTNYVGPKTLSVAPPAQNQSMQQTPQSYPQQSSPTPQQQPSYVNPTNPQQMMSQQQPTPQMATGPGLQATPRVATGPGLQASNPTLGAADIRNQWNNRFQQVMGRAGTEADWQGQVQEQGARGPISNQQQLDDYFKRATAKYAPTNDPRGREIRNYASGIHGQGPSSSSWLQPGDKLMTGVGGGKSFYGDTDVEVYGNSGSSPPPPTNYAGPSNDYSPPSRPSGQSYGPDALAMIKKLQGMGGDSRYASDEAAKAQWDWNQANPNQQLGIIGQMRPSGMARTGEWNIGKDGKPYTGSLLGEYYRG